MTIVFTMTSRMMTIAGACALLFCVALFLLGMQIGTQYGHPSGHLPDVATSSIGTGALSTTSLPARAAMSDSNDTSGKPYTNDSAAASFADAPSFSSDTSKP